VLTTVTTSAIQPVGLTLELRPACSISKTTHHGVYIIERTWVRLCGQPFRTSGYSRFALLNASRFDFARTGNVRHQRLVRKLFLIWVSWLSVRDVNQWEITHGVDTLELPVLLNISSSCRLRRGGIDTGALCCLIGVYGRAWTALTDEPFRRVAIVRCQLQ